MISKFFSTSGGCLQSMQCTIQASVLQQKDNLQDKRRSVLLHLELNIFAIYAKIVHAYSDEMRFSIIVPLE